MAEFEIWYSEVETFKGYFHAKDKKEAEELLDKLRSGLIDFDDIEGWYSKAKEYSLELEPKSVTKLD